MKRDIEFKELIKIISEIENKNKEKVVEKQDKVIYTKEYVENKFNEDIPLVDKLNLLKIYESQYNLQSLSDMQKLFMTEAKLLENIYLYEDYYNNFYTTAGILSQMDSYFSYKKFSILELRRYLTWRTKLRKGIFTYTNSKFIYTYVNEIYNLIGVKDANEGFDILVFLLDNLIYLSPRNENIFKQIVLEYIYLHNIEVEKTYSKDVFLKIFIENSDRDLNLSIDQDIYNYYVKNYMTDNVFFEKEEKKFKKILRKVLYKLNIYFKDNNQHFSKLIYKKINNIYRFDYLNFFVSKDKVDLLNYEKHINFDNKINILFQGNYINSITYYYDFAYSKVNRYIFSLIEYYIRLEKNYRNIKKKEYPRYIEVSSFDKFVNELEYIIDDIVRKEVYRELNDSNIEIDLSKLNKIRLISNEVSSKLITEFDKEEDIYIETIEKEIDKSWNGFYNELTLIQKEFLKKVINMDPYLEINKYCKDNNILMEVLIESINELAFDLLEDNIIEDMMDEVVIYPEYLDNLKEIIKE